MTKLPDISEFYTQDRALKEEVAWICDSVHGRHFDFLLPRVKKYGIKSVIEFGCGAGIVAKEIQPLVESYLGIDMNEHFLKAAKARNPEMRFEKGDVRSWVSEGADLALASAFLKHFSLEEWDAILAKLLSAGRYACFDVQLCANEHDDGSDYHHVFVSETHLDLAIHAAGHVVVDKFSMNGRTLPSGDAASDMLLWTRRRE